MSSKVPPKKIATRSVRAGLESDPHHGSVVPPIYLSTNFAFESYRQPRKYDYTRSGNPTRDQLAGALADLEGGAGAIVTCTGFAAITLILGDTARPAPASSRPTIATAAPIGCWRRCTPRAIWWWISSTRATRPSCARALASRRGSGMDRDPEQSLAARGRYPRDRRGRACGRRDRGRWTILFCRRSGSSPCRWARIW